MARVVDVAEYILKQRGAVTAMKLQKLVYYALAWSLVWDDAPLFPEPIEAWANGPVCPSLYARHRFEYTITTLGGDADALTPSERDTVDAVLRAYGDKSSQWLSDLTHSEAPWKDARRGIADGASSTERITHVMMAEFYSAMTDDNAKPLG